MTKSIADMTPAELQAAHEQAVARLAEHLLRRGQRGRAGCVRLELAPPEALALVATIHLAMRHPGYTGPPVAEMRSLVNRLIDELADGDVEISLLLRRGEDPAYDDVEL
jgi:hypothetical protein